ncbi:MAG: HAMP domain-containing histidine kinase [Pedosphaera sp.]|nr:HAMP domain-containing histidine kinase [Pedosphaera sp.]
MTIRTRLSLWYATIMFISLLVMGVLTYEQFAPEPDRPAKKQAADKEDFQEALANILWCGIPAALLALAGGWFLMRRALTPVAALTAAAGQVNESNLRRQLPRSGNGDELDRLTEVFNAMTARLDGSFQRVREFTLHASHELKTPLTIMHGELETELRDEKLAAAQREQRVSQLDEVQRLSKIVDGLTLLTKADAGQVQLVAEPVRLDEVVRETFADAQILAEPRGVKVELTACEELTVRGDRHRLRQLLLNLADNAIKYNAPRGDVKLALRHAGDAAEFTIANTGAGIPPELLPKVFDRFFRGDASHNAEVDGCGLGLSIAQWIVSAHGGSIRIASAPAISTIVTVRLPLEAAGKTP